MGIAERAELNEQHLQRPSEEGNAFGGWFLEVVRMPNLVTVTLITDKEKLHNLLKQTRKRIKVWQRAADGDSNDAEHEAAFALSELTAELLNLLDGRRED